MAKNRRADAVMFGFDFQVNAAIVLMLENIEYLEYLRLEGNNEDIELKLENDQYILAQAKSVKKSSTDFRNVRTNLKKSVITLSEASQKVDAKQLILITNSPNPLNEDASRSAFYGPAHRSFSSLPDSSQKIIKDCLEGIEQPLDLAKFMIQVLPFETDDDFEKYKVVKQNVDDFVGKLNLNIPGLGKKLMNIWQNEIFHNGTKENVDIIRNKRDIVWPIIVIATDVERCDDLLLDYFDQSQYDEIIHQYRNLIDSCCERCEFFIKVLHDYNEYKYAGNSLSQKCLDFALNKWEEYLPELKVDTDAETQKGLIQIILYSIVRNRIQMQRIKGGVNL